MAKYVNNLVYTEHALMDEVVYQTKSILANIVLKNSVEADKNETEDSIVESDYFIACKNGSMELSFFPLTVYELQLFGYSPDDAEEYYEDRSKIPEKDKESLLKFLVDYYIKNYEEKNNYYRTLAGLPYYGTTEYNIKIAATEPEFEAYDGDYDFPYDQPIHYYSIRDINTLKSLGIIDRLIEEHADDKIHYKYLNFLGSASIDVYKARIAAEWDILFMPDVENLVKTRFQELYAINRDIYLKRTYQLAYSWMSDYYEEMVMIMVLSQTFTDLITELPEWYIRRDIFDLRSVQYFLESQGVKFFKEIPLKYQIKIVKNLNRLIKFKSTNQNIHDILEIFAVEGTTVYKYYIYKDYLPAGTTGSGVETDEYGNPFRLSFLQVPIDESFDKYVQDNMNIKDYDEVVKSDKYWDGVDTHELIRDLHAEKDFSIEGTKYMFFDYQVNISDYEFQLCYFIGMIFSSKTNIEDITIMIQSISETSYYSLTDLCLLLICLAAAYLGHSAKIHIPMMGDDGPWHMKELYDFGDEEKDTIKFNPATGGVKYDFGYNYNVNPNLPTHVYDFNEEIVGENYESSQDIIDYLSGASSDITASYRTGDDYYWIRDKHPELWLYNKWKICGFNLEVNLEQIEKDISIRHSAFGFEDSYSLSDFGCDTFINDTDINSIEKLNNVYMTNKACYDSLMKFLVEDCDTKDKEVVAQYVFDSLFLTPFDLEFYRLKSGQIASTYVELLKERSYSLYKFYADLVSESDTETMKDGIRTILNDIVTNLEYFIGNQDNLEFIFSFVPTSSNEAIIQYISLIINFFKSWKVYFLDPASTYNINEKYGDRVQFFENIKEVKTKYWKDDRVSMRDVFVPFVVQYLIDTDASFYKEVIDIYAHYDNDPLFDNNYDGYFPIASVEDYIDANGGTPANGIPYVMVNAGEVAAHLKSKLGTFDLDGALPYDNMYHSDIDGKDVSELANDPVRYLNYEVSAASIDGGYAGNKWSDTIITEISPTLQISNDVIVSDFYYDNGLIIDSEGLYYGDGSTNHVTRTQFNEAVSYINDYIEGYLIPLGINYNDIIELFSSERYMDTMIEQYVEISFDSVIRTPSTFNRLITTILGITDKRINGLEEMVSNSFWDTF